MLLREAPSSPDALASTWTVWQNDSTHAGSNRPKPNLSKAWPVHIRQADASELGAFLKGEKGDGGKRAVVTLLVSAEHGEDERNASFLVTLHRPVPAHVRVKEVTLTRRAVAASMTRAKWSISLVVEEDAVAITDLAPGELRVVIGAGIDVAPDDGRRVVATAAGEAGALEAVLDPT